MAALDYDIFSVEVGLNSFGRRDLPLNGSTALADPITEGVSLGSMLSGDEVGGIMAYGKTSFSDTLEGWIQGLDGGVYKWLIGNSSNSMDWSVTTEGVLTVKGTVVAESGTIGGFTIGATDLSAVSGGDTVILSSGATAFTAGPTGAATVTITQAGVLTCTGAVISGGITTTAGSSLDGQYLSAASVPSAAVNLALRGWVCSCVFSVTDADTVAWDAGTLTASDGTAYSINAGNTGNMAAKTYIFLDIAVSLTVLQTTTTAANATGNGKLLVAVAQNGATEATFSVLNDSGLNINAADIVAGSITANEIAATTITAGNMNVSTLSSMTADLGTITAGTITLDSSGHIKSGQTAYDTGAGFWLGYDSAAKFSIGDSAGYKMTWDGSNLTLVGTFTGTASWSPTASDNLKFSADTPRVCPVATSAISKTFTSGSGVWQGTGTFRIKFDLKSTDGVNASQGQIYRNGGPGVGTAVGTLRSTLSTSYVTYSEDIAGWTAGDTVDLVTYNAHGDGYVRNFRLYYDRTSNAEMSLTYDA